MLVVPILFGAREGRGVLSMLSDRLKGAMGSAMSFGGKLGVEMAEDWEEGCAGWASPNVKVLSWL